MRIVRVLVPMFLVLLVTNGMAQDNQQDDQNDRARRDRRTWDPAQMQERILARQKETLGIGDEEWEAVKPLVAAVYEKARAVRELEDRGWGRRGRDREQAPEVAAVTAAMKANDTEPLKAALAALRAAREARQAELEQAQEALREVLTLEQEAKLVLSGTLE